MLNTVWCGASIAFMCTGEPEIHVTPFLALSWWSRTKSTVFPRRACILLDTVCSQLCNLLLPSSVLLFSLPSLYSCHVYFLLIVSLSHYFISSFSMRNLSSMSFFLVYSISKLSLFFHYIPMEPCWIKNIYIHSDSVVKSHFVCECRRCGFNPWIRKIPWRRKWQPTPVFLPGKFHGQRSLVGYSPWGNRRVGQDLLIKQHHIYIYIYIYICIHTHTHTHIYNHICI